MAKLGANLILQGRDKSHAEKVVNELAPYGVQVKAVGCNLENEAEIEAALAEIDSFGVQVDLVFNNAGLMSHYFSDFTTNTMDDFRQAMAVNFFAPIKIAYHFLPGMIQRGFGRMQLTTSGIAFYLCPKRAPIRLQFLQEELFIFHIVHKITENFTFLQIFIRN